jgi:hypothetical protein
MTRRFRIVARLDLNLFGLRELPEKPFVGLRLRFVLPGHRETLSPVARHP